MCYQCSDNHTNWGENICDVMQHGITGGTLACILTPIWFADLLADGEPYYITGHNTIWDVFFIAIDTF